MKIKTADFAKYFVIAATIALIAPLSSYANNELGFDSRWTPENDKTDLYIINPILPPNVCEYITLDGLKGVITDEQYNLLARRRITEKELNESVKKKDKFGKLQTYHKYIIAKPTLTGNIIDDKSRKLLKKKDTTVKYKSNLAWRDSSGQEYVSHENYIKKSSSHKIINDTDNYDYQIYNFDLIGSNDDYIDNPDNVFAKYYAYGAKTQGVPGELEMDKPYIQLKTFKNNKCPANDFLFAPLILDMNADGKANIETGIGVDIDINGTSDIAAVNGDKMLAMCDLDRDYKITGKEIFGIRTEDPFTGRPIKAANGFIALKEIALSAEKFTGIKCMDGTYADVTKINQALAKFKKGKIGLISGNNVTFVEPLGKVAKINTEYTEVDKHAEDRADIKHKQISNWLDIKNVSHIVHDVWFTIKNIAKKLVSAIANAFPF